MQVKRVVSLPLSRRSRTEISIFYTTNTIPIQQNFSLIFRNTHTTRTPKTTFEKGNFNLGLFLYSGLFPILLFCDYIPQG